MKITIAKVQALNPCKDRFDNFANNNPDFNGTLAKFLSLDNISYHDKIWVAARVLTKTQAIQWSIACAESVKHIFENELPKNRAVSNLLNYMKSGLDFDNLREEEKAKLIELKYLAYDTAGVSAIAAYYAANAANANAVYYADNAANAVYYAAKAAANAAYYAVKAAVYAEQEDLNLLFLTSILN